VVITDMNVMRANLQTALGDVVDPLVSRAGQMPPEMSMSILMPMQSVRQLFIKLIS
jgi:hypothetical protein